MKCCHTSFIFLLTLLSFMSCNKNDGMNGIDEMETVVEMEEVESRFEQFLGTWELTKIIENGTEYTPTLEIMTIDEDENRTDKYAVGTYQIDSASVPMTITLGSNENQIILERGFITFDCTYDIINENLFELDDSSEDYAIVYTWKRQE